MDSKAIVVLAVVVALGACTTLPEGPSVMALPGTGKSFEQFRGDDGSCRQYALQQLGGTTPNQAASDSTVRSAAVGTAVGALAGAAINGRSGAAAGAGAGLLVGTAAGAGAGEASAYGAQRRYDHAYIQCMYAMGHRVPVYGRFSGEVPRPSYPPPPPPPGGAAR
jgi:hypothetical protein